MKLRNRSTVRSIEQWAHRNLITIRRMERQLMQPARELPPEFSGLHAAITSCQKSVGQLKREVEALYESDKITTLRAPETPLTIHEIGRLLALNRQLRDVTRHLHTVAEDVTPRLEAKLADPVDPMVDYEIEVRIDYQLRADDPDYAEDDDNFLTTRSESLKGIPMQEEREDFAESHCPVGLRAEPHCWLFHDLSEHDYGADSPSLSLKDCLRIGRIFVDVQVWQQYTFDIPSESER